MSIKFIHRRYVMPPTEVDEKRGASFSLSCKGGVTVGYKWDEENKMIKLAVARCCAEDNFNRRVARDIVIGRMECKRPNRHQEIDLRGVPDLTPQAVEDIVWGWLENQERLWDADISNYSIH